MCVTIFLLSLQFISKHFEQDSSRGNILFCFDPRGAATIKDAQNTSTLGRFGHYGLNGIGWHKSRHLDQGMTDPNGLCIALHSGNQGLVGSHQKHQAISQCFTKA